MYKNIDLELMTNLKKNLWGDMFNLCWREGGREAFDWWYLSQATVDSDGCLLIVYDNQYFVQRFWELKKGKSTCK